MTIEVDTPVGGIIQQPNGSSLPESMKIQISSANGDWQSGLIEVKNNAFFTKVTLREKRVNSFQISLLDNKGIKFLWNQIIFQLIKEFR